MPNFSRMDHDELLEEAHNRWLEEVEASGLPQYLHELYSFNPLCISFPIEEESPDSEEVEKTPDTSTNQDLPF